MNQVPSALSPKDQVFWRTGRNFAAFQELEARLRQIVPLLSGAGTIESVTATVNAHRRSIKRSSLGDLIHQFDMRLFESTEPEQPPEDLQTIHFSFRTTIEASEEDLRALRKSWRHLVRERNRLAHSDFQAHDLESTDECLAFCTMLDAQLQRVLSLLSEVRGMQSGLVEAAKAQLTYLQSEEFQRLRNQNHSANDA